MWKTRIILDGHGYWQTFQLMPRSVKKALFAFPCVGICEHKLKRPHLTCSVCRGRRVYMKKMPNKIPVHVYTLLIHRDRRNAKVKNKLLKAVLTIAEVLAN